MQDLGFSIAEGYMVKYDVCPLRCLTNCRFRQGLFIKQGLDPFSASAGAGEVRDEGEQSQDRLIDRQREDQEGNVIVGCQLPAGQQYNTHQNNQPDPATQNGPAQHAHRRGRAGLHPDCRLPLLVKGFLKALKVLAGQIEGPEGLNAIDIFQDAGGHFTLGLLEIGADRPHPAQAPERKGKCQGDHRKQCQSHHAVEPGEAYGRQYKADHNDRRLWQ